MTQNIRLKRDVKDIAVEISKWALVIWLLWPLRQIADSSVPVFRIVAGIALFVIFGGKVLYDVIIMDYLKQKRVSMKKDLITLLGIVLVSALVVGIFLAFTAVLIITFMQQT